MSDRWPTSDQDHPCPTCGCTDKKCKVAPDGGAVVCWHSASGDFRGKARQLNNGHPRVNGNGHSGNGKAGKPKPPTKTFVNAAEALKALGRGKDLLPGTLAAIFDNYQDMAIGRWNFPNGDKEMRPVHRFGNGWRSGDPPEPLPLYCLRDALPIPGPLYVCEGEGKTDLSRQMKLNVITSSHGSSSALRSDWSPIAGRDLIILPDNDASGEKYARAVATIAIKLGCRVKIVRLPDLPEAGDMVQFVAARPDASPKEIKAEVEDIAAGVPWIDPADLIGGAMVRTMMDVQSMRIDWLWLYRWAIGKTALLVGAPGDGKSMLTMDFIARVSTGTPMPDGSAGRLGDVVLICAEDDAGDTIRPRLDAHHADLSRVHLLEGIKRVDENGKAFERPFTFAEVAALEDVVTRYRPLLVVVDPVGSFLGGETDAHRDNEVRAVLSPLVKLAAQYQFVLLIVAHTRKTAGGTADERTLGSRAFTGIVRSVMHVIPDSEDSNRRLLLPGKSNLARKMDGLAFSISGDDQQAAVCWEKEPVRMTADEALAEAEHGGKADVDEAVDWLRQALFAGPQAAKELKQRAKRDRISGRTLERAKAKLGAKAKLPHFQGKWTWYMPDSFEETASSVRQPPQGQIDLADSEANSSNNNDPSRGRQLADTGGSQRPPTGPVSANQNDLADTGKTPVNHQRTPSLTEAANKAFACAGERERGEA